jgi:hypothetical protein
MPAKAGIQHRLPMARVPLIDENAGAEVLGVRLDFLISESTRRIATEKSSLTPKLRG